MTYEESEKLVKLAKKKTPAFLLPMTFMGEAQQTAWKAIREDKLGKVAWCIAKSIGGPYRSLASQSRDRFYDVGALFDVGVYRSRFAPRFSDQPGASRLWKSLHPDRSRRRQEISYQDTRLDCSPRGNGRRTVLRLTPIFMSATIRGQRAWSFMAIRFLVSGMFSGI